MDPLSIIAGAIAVFQAADRFGSLCGGIKSFLNSPKDVALLSGEVMNVRNALEALQNTLLAVSLPSRATVEESIRVCLACTSDLEDVLAKTSVVKHSGELSVKRSGWLRKRGEIEMIKIRLRDSMSALQLAISSLQLASQIRLCTSMESFDDTLRSLQRCNIILPEVQRPGDFSGGADTASPGILPAPSRISGRHALVRSDKLIVKKTKINCPPGVESEKHVWYQYSQGGFRIFKLLCGTLGTLVTEWNGARPGYNHVELERCSPSTIQSLSVAYYGSFWTSNITFRLSLRISSPLCVSLSFPRILPPDSEIFVGIRLGQVERIKTIIVEGRGSVADVLAPYGLSTLSLALLYQQTAIYQLLLSAGASRVPLINLTCPGRYMASFWNQYTSRSCNISASDILDDYIAQMGSASHAKLLPKPQETSIFGSESFTRLQKCTIGLTSESLKAILPDTQSEINDTDSAGRTALHLAAYLNNAKALKVLITWGANANLRDQWGKAPLHIAVGLGSFSAVDAMLVSSPALEVQDHFGNTPLHLACLLGHTEIAELLLDKGADMEAINYHGETPLRQAVLADEVEIVKLFQNRGAAFTPQDSLGSTFLHKAVWFNSHDVFRFLIGLKLRVDQKMYTQKTLLHLLGDHGDGLTMEIFLGINHATLGRLDPEDIDDNGYSAMKYLESRENSEELMEPFQRTLELVKAARQRVENFIVTTNPPENRFEAIGENYEEDVFLDAVEFQTGTAV